jgi:uncharacterized membrane protein (UPF0182 family)
MLRRQPTYSVGPVTNLLNQPTSPTTASRERRRPVFLASLYLLRTLATVHLALALTQAVSIGQYLDGRYGLLQWHQVGAGLLTLSGLVLALVAVGHVLSGGRLGVLGCVLLFLAEGIQTGAGYSRQLGLHVPLGVAIVTAALVVAVWTWTPAARRARPRRPRPARTAGVRA